MFGKKKEWKSGYGQRLPLRGPMLVGLLVFSVLVNIGAAYAHQSMLQRGIAKEVLRFHVLANSDEEKDQKVKLQVRDTVLAWIGEHTKTQGADGSMTKKELQQFLTAHLEDLEDEANRILEEAEMHYRASASVELCYFPERTYGDCTFPAGWYDALRIRLGEAQGHNWWCVLYPRLCFSDCLHARVGEEQKKQLAGVLTQEEYESLLHTPERWRICFRWFDFF